MRKKILMPITILLFIFTLSHFTNSVAEESKIKYKDFELKPVYGISNLDLRTKRESPPSQLIDRFSNMWGTGIRFGVNSFVEFGVDKYFFIGSYFSRDKKVVRKYSTCDYSKSVQDNLQQNCGSYVLVVADLMNNTIQRIDNRKIPEASFNGMFRTGQPQAYRAYGCYIGNPFSAADLDLDGTPELFFVGGIGDFGGDEGGKTIQTNLFIFKLTENAPKELIKLELSYDNLSELALTRTSKYQSFSERSIKPDGTTMAAAQEPGIRRYSKLFFKDFDKNDRLDILVWQREYQARLKTDSEKGYNLNTNNYRLFEEAASGFTEKTIDSTTAEKYLNEHQLTWRKGFPNVNHCYQKEKDDTLIESYPDPVHNINDPVLNK